MLLDVYRALDGLSDGFDALLLILSALRVYRRPHHDHGITNELDDVTAVLVQVIDHSIHVTVDAQGDFLVTLDALAGARLTEVREPRNVCEHDNCFHVLRLRHLLLRGCVHLLLASILCHLLLLFYHLLDHERRNILAQLYEVTDLAEVIRFRRDRRPRLQCHSTDNQKL